MVKAGKLSLFETRIHQLANQESPRTRWSHPNPPTTMAPKLRSKSVSGRTHRAKSLPAGRLDPALSSPIKSPRKPTPFKLGRIIPNDISICKSCKTPILKSPATPKLNKPARSLLEDLLQSSLLQAHSRTVGIQTAFASASKDYQALENKDDTGPSDDFEDFKISPGLRTAPYTAEIWKVMGTLYGELGRALATSQKTIRMLDALLQTERARLQAGESQEQKRIRMEEENKWFRAQHYARYLASLPKKRIRHRKALDFTLR